ncbi:MAG TPA: hypothetical protein VFW87_05975 [Pirellulales bacterium]|nr:hypothetical protein [Pirellulales bacterium]
MPRTLTANFRNLAASKSAAPYQVLEVDWGAPTGVQYYLDRPASSFITPDNFRIPAAGVDANVNVLQWPACSLSMKEGQIGATEQTQVVLDDAAGAITAILNTADQQRKLVTVWRMFDDPTCVWGTDNAEILTGVLRPFDWTASNNQITLNLGDLGPLLAKSISCPATAAVFPNIPNQYQDKNIPLCWGYAQRVEAVLVSRPWSTSITQATDGSSPVTVNIADDPDSMGVDGTGQTSYPAFLGLDSVLVKFNQSSSPGDVPSTATITKNWEPTLATAVVLGTVDGANHPRIIIQDQHIQPLAVGDTLDAIVAAGTNVQICMAKYGIYATTLATIITQSPWPGWYIVAFNDPQNIIAANLEIGDQIKFLKNGQPMRAWPVGSVLRALSGSYIYLANALPSKNVARVEGFGSVADQAGANRKDFITLGAYRSTHLAGSSTTTTSGTSFQVNLNDNTWNNPPGAGLGQNVTSITFPGSPRDLDNTLDDDRIWVTLEGVEDRGDSTGNLIANPATIILQYLENPRLMNVAAGSINAASFTAAATALANYQCGFAQLEAADGLSLLQHIAQLCHSFLFFDQGQANLVVLSDAPATIQHTFDTITSDNLLQGSLSQSETPVDDIVNDLTFKWRGAWDDKTGNKLMDSKNVRLTSIAAFGRMAREINPVDIYWRRGDVAAERDWWLGHLSSIFRYVRFTAFLDALVLQPGDWINLTWIDGGGRNLFGGSKAMLVTQTTDTGKDGLVQIEARYVQ